MEKSYKKIHSKKIAIELIRRGHDFVSCEPHHTKTLTVFLFEKTEKLERDLNEIFS